MSEARDCLLYAWSERIAYLMRRRIRLRFSGEVFRKEAIMCTGTLWTIVSLSRLNAIIELAPYGYRAKLNAVFHLARMRPRACCCAK